jgi:hypothetical protein
MPRKPKLTENEKRIVQFMFALATVGILFSILLAFLLRAPN